MDKKCFKSWLAVRVYEILGMSSGIDDRPSLDFLITKLPHILYVLLNIIHTLSPSMTTVI